MLPFGKPDKQQWMEPKPAEFNEFSRRSVLGKKGDITDVQFASLKKRQGLRIAQLGDPRFSHFLETPQVPKKNHWE